MFVSLFVYFRASNDRTGTGNRNDRKVLVEDGSQAGPKANFSVLSVFNEQFYSFKSGKGARIFNMFLSFIDF